MNSGRRILKIKWADKVKNEEVLVGTEGKMGIWNYLKRRRDKLIGWGTIWDTQEF